ncbi:hypothetical protein [Roseovarius atlanticus]|uniref:hypothetical protein n=1 Tax=Roseovarius atlanticus TaxID=1641875 RepID=UPI001C94AAF9|nr:hypothetical protein [Roseovarius atlanticus]MBY6123541.1 hypothetical protein [Roseovarius atlanticus]MBY6148036.1 hypothetical protein [Roseovarius atlanticus]
MNEILKRFRSAFFSRKRLARGYPRDGRTIAEDYDLASVLCRLVAAPVNFLKKAFHPGKPFDIACFAPDDASLLHGFRGEKVIEPYFGRQGRAWVLHEV